MVCSLAIPGQLGSPGYQIVRVDMDLLVTSKVQLRRDNNDHAADQVSLGDSTINIACYSTNACVDSNISDRESSWWKRYNFLAFVKKRKMITITLLKGHILSVSNMILIQSTHFSVCACSPYTRA
jgi:hypothetical protein